MAKKLTVAGVEPTETGVRLKFERLGDRFECDVASVGVPALIGLMLKGLARQEAAYRTEASEFAFMEKPDREGAAPTLMFSTPNGLIALDLTWSLVNGLSQTAAEMLRHQPEPDRPN